VASLQPPSPARWCFERCESDGTCSFPQLAADWLRYQRLESMAAQLTATGQYVAAATPRHVTVTATAAPAELRLRLAAHASFPAQTTVGSRCERERRRDERQEHSDVEVANRTSREGTRVRDELVTWGCMCTAKVWALCLVQGPFPVAPCPTLLVGFVTSTRRRCKSLTRDERD
jgi:hypothetical protein